jgi:ABC-type transport system involved in multi-copper enzyme maturation permease subunit
MSKNVVMNLIRIWAIGSNSFREIIRDRILYVVGIFILVMVLAWRVLPEVAPGAQDKILLDFGLAVINVLAVGIAILLGGNLINKEIDRKTILALIPKPLSRAEFIIGKHLGLSAVLAVLVALMMAIYLGVLTIAKVAYPIGPLLMTSIFLILELVLIVAAAIFFGSITSSILATLLTGLVYLAGHGSRDMVSMAHLGESKSPGFQKLADGLFLILPDLSRFDLKNSAVYSVLPNSNDLWTSFGYSIIYTAVFLVITIALFSRREF